MQLEELFPYDSFRVGQRDLTESVYRSCKNKGRLVVEAMSGFGKTSSVLTGAILAAQEENRRIIYACRTKRQVFRVMEEIERIQRRTPLGAVQLFAKTDYCLLKEMSKFNVNQESFKWYCSFNTTNNLCSYFLNVSLLSREIVNLVRNMNTRVLTQSELLEKCKGTHVCPYEVIRVAMATSRIVVTTYHYLFDESSRSLLLSSTGWQPSETIIVIDEAHNLRDFLSDAYTANLSFDDIERAQRDAGDLYLDRTKTFLEFLEDCVRGLASERAGWFVDKKDLLRRIQGPHDEAWLPNLALELSTCAGIGWQTISTGRNLPTSIMKVGSFLNQLLVSEQSGTTLAKSDEGLYLVETNPSKQFGKLVSEYHSLVLLSATINPSNLFLKSIGLSEDTKLHKVLPNQKFRVRTVIDTGTSTRFKTRSSLMYSQIASKVAAVCRATRGSVGVFVPSYLMLDSLRPYMAEELPDKEVVSEERHLSNHGAEEVIEAFKSRPGSVLLAVQGARFSEGEDFPGDQMDASIVVGLSLPPPSPTMYAQFADSEFGRHDTYLVVSLLPAIRKAIQSAGRHIRSPDKKGMVFLLDSRFAQPELLEMMPGWMKGDILKGDFRPSEIEGMVRGFFNSDV